MKQEKHETPTEEAKMHSKKYLISALRKEDPKVIITGKADLERGQALHPRRK